MFKKPNCPVIAVEEHYWDAELSKTYVGLESGRPGPQMDRLFDLGALRIKEMDEAGIDARVFGRQKTPYSIWRKLQRKSVGFSSLFATREVTVADVLSHRTGLRWHNAFDNDIEGNADYYTVSQKLATAPPGTRKNPAKRGRSRSYPAQNRSSGSPVRAPSNRVHTFT